jgi:hypothetical protein
VLLQCANGNRGFIELFGPAEAEIETKFLY